MPKVPPINMVTISPPLDPFKEVIQSPQANFPKLNYINNHIPINWNQSLTRTYKMAKVVMVIPCTNLIPPVNQVKNTCLSLNQFFQLKNPQPIRTPQ